MTAEIRLSISGMLLDKFLRKGQKFLRICPEEVKLSIDIIMGDFIVHSASRTP